MAHINMKIHAVRVVGNNPLTEHQATLANPKAKPGSIQKVRWSKEILKIFKTEFALSRHDLACMGAQPIYHHPDNFAQEHFENQGKPSLEGSSDPYDWQWYSAYQQPHLPSIPYKFSIRVPVVNRLNDVIDHQYYQLVPHHDGHGHTIERFRPTETAPPSGFLLDSDHTLNTKTNIIVADDPFLASQIWKAHWYRYSVEPAVLLTHGILESGFSGGSFRFNTARHEMAESTFNDRDLQSLVEHLGLPEIDLNGRNVMFFLEGDWLHRTTLDGSMALLQQATELRNYIVKRGGRPCFLTPPEINPDGGPTDLAHLVAIYGYTYDSPHCLNDLLWPGFQVAC